MSYDWAIKKDSRRHLERLVNGEQLEAYPLDLRRSAR